MIPSSTPAVSTPRFWRWLLSTLTLVTLLAGLLGVFRLGLSLGEPFPGFVLLWRKEFKLLTVSYVTPPSWSGPAAGMRINDRILCINGYSPKPDSPVYGLDPRYAEHPCPNGSKNYAVIFREAAQTEPRAVDFFIDRNTQLMTIPGVPLVNLTLALLLETLAPPFLLGLGLLSLGWVVYRANPGVEINLVFSLIMLIISNFTFNGTLAGQISDRQFETGMITMVQIVPWLALLGPLAFHLADLLTSPGPFSRASRLIRRPYYLVGAGFSLLGVLAYFFNTLPVSQPLNLAYILWDAVSWSFSILWALASLGLTYRRTDRRQVRMQTGLVLTALGLTVGICIPFLSLFILDSLAFPYMQGLPYVGLVVVGLIAYAILRYQLFASRTQVLTFLLVMVVSVLAALVVYLPVGYQVSFIPLLGTSLLAGSVFAGRFKPFSFLDRLLHHQELDYQAAARFSQRIRQPQSTGGLASAASSALKDELETEQVELWLLNPDQLTLEYYPENGPTGTTSLDPDLAARLVQAGGPVYASAQAGLTFVSGLPGGSGLSPAGLWVPLVERDQAVGLLYIGPRWTGEVYNEEDLLLVRLLTVPLGLAVANISQVEHLRDLQRLILQAGENERSKIARELHDTVLQFLLVLTFGLDGLKEKPPQLSERIEDWQGRISAEASRLRDLVNYLRAPETLEQRGLAASLEQLLGDMRRQAAANLTWEMDPQVDQVLAPETKVAIYRTLREAVHNAIKHARPRQITICLEVQPGQVIFSVQDDGQGFDIQQALQPTHKGYSSLQDMILYIESTGGKLELRSAPGQGTRIQGWTPTIR